MIVIHGSVAEYQSHQIEFRVMDRGEEFPISERYRIELEFCWGVLVINTNWRMAEFINELSKASQELTMLTEHFQRCVDAINNHKEGAA